MIWQLSICVLINLWLIILLEGEARELACEEECTFDLYLAENNANWQCELISYKSRYRKNDE